MSIQRSGIVFANKMGNSYEINNSEIGPNLATNGTVNYANGKIGFRGAIDLVETGNVDDPTFVWPTGDWAVHIKVYITSGELGDIKRWVTNYIDSNSAGRWFLRQQNGDVVIFWPEIGYFGNLGAVVAETWEDYMVCYDSSLSVGYVYRNGSLVNTSPTITPHVPFVDGLYIGGRFGTVGERVHGRFDNVRIFDYCNIDPDIDKKPDLRFAKKRGA